MGLSKPTVLLHVSFSPSENRYLETMRHSNICPERWKEVSVRGQSCQKERKSQDDITGKGPMVDVPVTGENMALGSRTQTLPHNNSS